MQAEFGVTDEPPAGTVPTRTMGDWLRLGALAERLQLPDPALSCYKRSVQAGLTIRGWFSIAALSAKHGWIADALFAVHMLRRLFRSQPAYAALLHRGPLHEALCALCVRHGLSGVKSHLKDAEDTGLADMLDHLRTWGIPGSDR